MKLTFLDTPNFDQHKITTPHSLEEYMYPDIKMGFELLGMHVRSVKDSWVYPRHEHSKYEINFLLEGHQVFQVKGNTYHLFAGDMVFVRPGDSHSSQCGKENGFTYFCLHFDMDDKLFLPYLHESDDVFFSAESKLSMFISPYIKRMVQFCKEHHMSLTHYIHIHTQLFELLGALIKGLNYEKDIQPEKEKYRQVAYQIAEKIEKLVKRTEVHRSDNKDKTGIKEIAKELNISNSYCHKLFKKVYQMSPRQYLSYMKLSEAKALLIDSTYTVEQIAYILGYHDSAHFSRQFKRWSGITPSQYRLSNVKCSYETHVAKPDSLHTTPLPLGRARTQKGSNVSLSHLSQDG
ncbi:AraC family transcriptional regulator [Alkalihalobacillus pseudalcaliphilus]|uniref:AraC family transcriptional regulator n=1 Tax=Alkalihalobacillus pseudalcaliphilus TaxID=79884 RepID=UPI000840D8A0|nr:helix-turn-helix domain-containing protein [Alkalihalobacillus pseudalcaliphilus]